MTEKESNLSEEEIIELLIDRYCVSSNPFVNQIIKIDRETLKREFLEMKLI